MRRRSAFNAALGRFDALVSAIGTAGIGPLERLGDEAFAAGWRIKVMAQANLVRFGLALSADRRIQDVSGLSVADRAETATAYVRPITGTMNGNVIDPRR